MQIPQLSIIVPTYNVARYLPTALAALAAQTVASYEIIVVDDGATDGSGRIADDWAARDARIRVIHQRNGGLSAARNAGILAARGDYVGFVDPDDTVDPAMFAELLAAAAPRAADLALCGYLEEYEGSDVAVEVRHPYLPAWLGSPAEVAASFVRPFAEGRLPGYAWNKIFKRRLLHEHGLLFTDGLILIEDSDFLLRVLPHVASVACVDRALYHYRRNADSICAAFRPNRFALMRQVYAARQALLADCGGDERLLLSGFRRLVGDIILDEGTARNPLPLREQYRRLAAVAGDALVQQAFARADEAGEPAGRRWLARAVRARQAAGLLALALWHGRVLSLHRRYLSGLWRRLRTHRGGARA